MLGFVSVGHPRNTTRIPGRPPVSAQSITRHPGLRVPRKRCRRGGGATLSGAWRRLENALVGSGKKWVAHPLVFKGAVFDLTFAARTTASQSSIIHGCVRHKNRKCCTASPSDRAPDRVSTD